MFIIIIAAEITDADVGRPSFECPIEVNRQYVLVAAHRTCTTNRIYLLELIN
jgi:hypothetical protein